MKILAIIISCLFLFWALAGIFVTPSFEELYISLGSDLPVLTKLVFITHKYWVGLALIPLPLFYLLEKSKLWQVRILYCLLALAIVLMPLTVVAIYLPMYELGKVVG